MEFSKCIYMQESYIWKNRKEHEYQSDANVKTIFVRSSKLVKIGIILINKFNWKDISACSKNRAYAPPPSLCAVENVRRASVWRKQNFTVKLWFLSARQLECKGWLVRANSRGTITFETSEQRRGVLSPDSRHTFLLRPARPVVLHYN